MDRTVLTLAVDSSQVGTAAAAFGRMVDAGNAAATSAGRVTSATLLEGRTIQQTLIPALTNSINRTRTLDEAQAELGRDASRQFGQNLASLRNRANATSTSVRDAITNARASSEQTLPRIAPAPILVSTARAVTSAAPTLAPVNLNSITQLASAAAGARLAIDRQTEAVNASRGAFVQLTQATEGIARSYRQNQTPVSAPAAQAPSAAAATIAAAPQASPSAMREVAQAMSLTAAQANRVTASVTEANRAIASTPRITAAASAVPAVRAPLVAQSIVSASTGQAVPTAAAPVAQLATDAGRAQTTVERLTAAARSQRGALVELAPAASAAAASYRQIAATPIRIEAAQGISTAAAALANVAAQAENANRAIAGLNRAGGAAPLLFRPFQAPQTQQAPQSRPASPAPSAPASSAPSPAGMNAFSAAVARSTTAVNELAEAEGRAGETARQLAEASARNEAAQARLASAISRVAQAQAELDSASRSSSGNTEAIAQAQTRLQSAQAAVSVASAAATRTQRSATEAADRHRTALNSLGRQTTLTAYQQQQLSFQLNDFFVQVASGGSPLTALIQQGSQLNGTFGGIRGSIRAIGSLITPFSVGVAAAAASVGAFGYAQYEASQRSKSFKDAIVLTGNFAGQTEEQFGEMARRISDSTNTSVGSVRDMATALARTGQVGPEVFEAATEAAVRYAKTTGKAMDEVASDVANSFAQMAKNPLKFVDDSNKSGSNVFSADDREAIKKLQDKGKLDDAATIVLEKWSARLKQLGQNVGGFGKLLDSVKTSASQFWDFLGNLKLPSGILTSTAGFLGDAPIMTPTTAAMVAAEAEAQRKDQEKKAQKAKEEAADAAKQAGIRQRGTAAAERLDDFNVRANPAEGAKRARDLFEKDLADAAASGKSYTAAQVARMRLQNTLDNADPRVLQNAQVNYSARVQSFKDALEKEQAAITFHNQFLQGEYQAGAASLDKLYDDKTESIRKGVEAEIAELDKEKAATQQLLKSVIDPTQRRELQAQINRFDVQKDKVRQKGGYDEALNRQEREQAKRAMDDQVDNFRANLKQSSGDDLGAAMIRAQVSERQNRILASQSGGKITDDDVRRQTALTEAVSKFADIQTKVGFVAQSTARAEEAANLVAELGGKSLLESETAIYEVRSRGLDQLGALTAKARELAAVSTDPKIKQFAADLALEYAKAANAIDPALNRLRDANRELASGLAQTVSGAPNAFVDFYNQRRSQSQQDIKAQKDEYGQRIDQLRGYLAQEKDVRNKAVLQKRIDQLQGESDGLKVESKGKTALEAIKSSVLTPAVEQVSTAISKVLIQDPLQKYIEGQLKGLTEGDGILAGFFKDALGIKEDPKQQALLQQTAAISASTGALDALKTAAENAANALNKPLSGVRTQEGQASVAGGVQSDAQGSADPTQPPPVDPELAGAQSDVTQSLQVFDKQTITTASDVLRLASAAGEGGNAMVRLPGIVGLFQSAVMAMQGSSASSSGSSIGSFFTSLFGGSGSSASYEAAAASTGIFHSGGIVGQPPSTRNTPMSLFAGAPRYHTGGIVGKAADKVGEKLKHNEVPAILMGGPKGKREEVLRADDPRHRDNLGMSVVARILAESKAPKSSAAEVAKAAEPRTVASTLIKSIAGRKGDDESSANVLAGVLDRLGVKEVGNSEGAIKVRGARELGGPVSAGGMYRVNEKGPELLEVAGKQYLMMGSQGGKVEANPSKGDGPVIHQVINFHSSGPVTRQTQQQLAAAAYRGSARASSRNN